MHIDFHHGVTYVTARLAGFSDQEARIVAHSAQYVDDATNGGIVYFDNGALYRRVASAHKMLDYRNFQELANHQVWIPFHFLPGNGLKPAGQDPSGESFVHKIVCRPDSPIARDMVRATIEDHEKPYGLYRLGIAMHVYADTWAHQDFAGVNHDINNITELDDGDPTPGARALERLSDYFGELFDRKSGKLISRALPLGHGAALTYPDRPYLTWSFKDSAGRTIVRDNPKDFLAAADAMCSAMQRFRQGDPDAEVPGLPEPDRREIDRSLRAFTDPDGEVRHEQWLGAIAAGRFGFPGVAVSYLAKGNGSWKHRALRTEDEREAESDDEKRKNQFPYTPTFLTSDWKLFHDGLLAHRFDVVHDVLPRYGICAA